MSNKNKLWYKLENNIAKILGLKRISFSGGIWPNKEDAESIDYIVQCKATEGKGITIKAEVINQLVQRSLIQHKIPIIIFHIDSVKYDSGKTWVCMPINNFLTKDK